MLFLFVCVGSLRRGESFFLAYFYPQFCDESNIFGDNFCKTHDSCLKGKVPDDASDTSYLLRMMKIWGIRVHVSWFYISSV